MGEAVGEAAGGMEPNMARGSIIGGTALVEPEVLGLPYPHTVRVCKPTKYLEWRTDELRAARGFARRRGSREGARGGAAPRARTRGGERATTRARNTHGFFTCASISAAVAEPSRMSSHISGESSPSRSTLGGGGWLSICARVG